MRQFWASIHSHDNEKVSGCVLLTEQKNILSKPKLNFIQIIDKISRMNFQNNFDVKKSENFFIVLSISKFFISYYETFFSFNLRLKFSKKLMSL